MHSNFFSRMGQWQYFVELFIASIVLAFVLSLAEAQSWSNLNWNHVIQSILYINWVVLAFVALAEKFQALWSRVPPVLASLLGFCLVQLIIGITTLGLNVLFYWGSNFSLQNISTTILFKDLVLHCSYGVLLGEILIELMMI